MATNADLLLTMGATPGNVKALLDGVVEQSKRVGDATRSAGEESAKGAEVARKAWQQYSDTMDSRVGKAVAQVAKQTKAATSAIESSGPSKGFGAIEAQTSKAVKALSGFRNVLAKVGGATVRGFRAIGGAALKAGKLIVSGLASAVSLLGGPLLAGVGALLGLFVSGVRRTEEFQAAQERLTTQFRRMADEMVFAVDGGQGVADLMDLITAGIKAVTPWLAGFTAAVVAMARSSYEVAKELGAAFGELFEALIGDFSRFFEQARAVAAGLAAFPGPAQKAAQAILKMTSGLGDFQSTVRELTGGEFSIVADGLDAFIAAYDQAAVRLEQPLDVVDPKEAERRAKILARFSEERLDAIGEEIDALETLGLSHEQEGVFLASIAADARDAESALVTAWRQGLIEGDAFTAALERLNAELGKVQGLEAERERIKKLQVAAAKELAAQEKARLKVLEEEARLLERFSDERLAGIAEELDGVEALNLSQADTLKLIQLIGGEAQDAKAALIEAFRDETISADELRAGLQRVNAELDKMTDAQRLADLETLKEQLRDQRAQQLSDEGYGPPVPGPDTAEGIGQLPFADQAEGLGLGFGPVLPEEQEAGQILDPEQVDLWREVMAEVSEARLMEEDARERLIDGQLRWNAAAEASLGIAVKEGRSFEKRRKWFAEATKITGQFANALVDMAIAGELSGKKILAAGLKQLSEWARNKMLFQIAEAYAAAAAYDYKGAALHGLAAVGFGVLAAGAGVAAASVGSEGGRDEPGSAEKDGARSNLAASESLEDQDPRIGTEVYITGGNIYGGGTREGLAREITGLVRDAEGTSEGRSGTNRFGGP